MHAHFLALEKEFGWLFIYVNTLEVKHIERTVQTPYIVDGASNATAYWR